MSTINDLDSDALISRLAGPLSPAARAAFRAAAEDASLSSGNDHANIAAYIFKRTRAALAVSQILFDPLRLG
jgi:hypothetical protein